jgi:hypothetical protein
VPAASAFAAIVPVPDVVSVPPVPTVIVAVVFVPVATPLNGKPVAFVSVALEGAPSAPPLTRHVEQEMAPPTLMATGAVPLNAPPLVVVAQVVQPIVPLVVNVPPVIGPLVATLVTVPEPIAPGGPVGPVAPVGPATVINQSVNGPPLPDVEVTFTTRVVLEYDVMLPKKQAVGVPELQIVAKDNVPGV